MLHLMVGYILVMFSNPNFNMVDQLILKISIRSNTQSAFISSSASCAGVATEVGEVANDEKHLAAVE